MNVEGSETAVSWADFKATFVCPDPSGETAPCAGLAEPGHTPLIRFGQKYVPCPIYQRTECVPYRRQLEHRQRQELYQVGAELERAGVPRRIRETILAGGLTQTEALDAVRAFVTGAARAGRALVLLSPPGRGKSVALGEAVRLWGPGRSLFVEADTFVNQLLDWDAHGEAVTEAKDASLLALDDWGRGYMKRGGLAEESIEEVLAHRHSELRPTLVSSNWTPAQLRRRISPRLFDRFAEWADIVSLPGASLRVR